VFSSVSSSLFHCNDDAVSEAHALHFKNF